QSYEIPHIRDFMQETIKEASFKNHSLCTTCYILLCVPHAKKNSKVSSQLLVNLFLILIWVLYIIWLNFFHIYIYMHYQKRENLVHVYETLKVTILDNLHEGLDEDHEAYNKAKNVIKINYDSQPYIKVKKEKDRTLLAANLVAYQLLQDHVVKQYSHHKFAITKIPKSLFSLIEEYYFFHHNFKIVIYASKGSSELAFSFLQFSLFHFLQFSLCFNSKHKVAYDAAKEYPNNIYNLILGIQLIVQPNKINGIQSLSSRLNSI
ncbi:hypothetical protein ACJX0J_039444, partial [Zea mays]